MFASYHLKHSYCHKSATCFHQCTTVKFAVLQFDRPRTQSLVRIGVCVRVCVCMRVSNVAGTLCLRSHTHIHRCERVCRAGCAEFVDTHTQDEYAQLLALCRDNFAVLVEAQRGARRLAHTLFWVNRANSNGY
jgi:hypothetical protein